MRVLFYTGMGRESGCGDLLNWVLESGMVQMLQNGE